MKVLQYKCYGCNGRGYNGWWLFKHECFICLGTGKLTEDEYYWGKK